MPETHLIPNALPEGFGELHREVMSIRWGDMDAMMHVNNTVYFRFMEQARISWTETGVVGGMKVKAESGGSVIATAGCKFRRPRRVAGRWQGGSTRARSGVPACRRTTNFAVPMDPETVYATGEALFVWISNVAGCPVTFPEPVRRRLGSN